MTPMMPKMSVNPLATRNSSSPYCSAFRHWTRKVAKSIASSLRILGKLKSGARRPPLFSSIHSAAIYATASSTSHRAAASWIGEALSSQSDGLVLPVLDLSQVEVLHHVVRRRQRDPAARAVDLRRGHRPVEQLSLCDVNADGPQSQAQELRRIVALHGVDVGLGAVGLGVGEAECGVARCGQVVRVMQRSEEPLCGRTLCVERAVGKKPRAEQRDLLLEAGRGVVLAELDRASSGEEGVGARGLDRRDFRQERLEFHVRERDEQLLQHLAATLLEGLLEPADRLLAGGVLPGDRD